MEIKNEKTIEMVQFEFDMTNEDTENLLYYAAVNMPEEKLNELRIEWAVNDIIRKEVEEVENK